MYTLDTNAIIYYLQDDAAAVNMLRPIFNDETASVFISTMTELELFSYPAMTSEEEAAIEELLANTVRIVSVTSSIARMAGDLRRLYARLKPFDSAIAATAIFAHTKLVTRNVRDFEHIDELDILAI